MKTTYFNNMTNLFKPQSYNLMPKLHLHLTSIIMLLLLVLGTGKVWGQEPVIETGVYYILNVETGKFMSRGQNWGTKAVIKDYGLPWDVTVEDGKYTLRMADIKQSGSNNGFQGSFTDTANPYAMTATGNTVDGFKLNYYGDDMTANADGSITMSSSGDNSTWKFLTVEEYRTYKTQKTATQNASVLTAAGMSGDIASITGEMSSVDMSYRINGGNVPSNATWHPVGVTGRPGSQNNGAYGVEIYQGGGSYSYTATGLPKGIYKIEVRAMLRSVSNQNCYDLGQLGYDLSDAQFTANGSVVDIKDWYSGCSSNSSPDNTTDVVTRIGEGKYTSELYTYVGDDGVLELKATSEAYWSFCWFVFNGVTLTYFYDEDVEPTATFEDANHSMAYGESYTQAVSTNSRGVVSYESSDEEVATVAAGGIITTTGVGTSTITATVAAQAPYTSANASYTLVVNPKSPVISYDSETKTITMTSEHTGAKIYYTNDGTVPTTSSNLYTDAFVISETSTFRAIAVVDKSEVNYESAPCEAFEAIVTVSVPATLTGGATVAIGDVIKLTLNTESTGDVTYTFSSSNGGKVELEKVDGGVNVKAASVGNVTITAEIAESTDHRYAATSATFDLSVSSKIVGNVDNTTPFFAATTVPYVLTGNGTYHFVFNNYNSGSGETWNNWVLAVRNDADAELFALRADNYGWGTLYDVANLSGNINWTNFVTDMNGVTVDMTITRNGGKVIINSTASKNDTKLWDYGFESKEGVVTDDVKFVFGVDLSHIEMITAEQTASLPAIEPTITSDVTDATVPLGSTLDRRLQTNSYAPITYSSSVPGIASISDNGLITAISPGKTTITISQQATAANVFTAVQKQFEITVPSGGAGTVITLADIDYTEPIVDGAVAGSINSMTLTGNFEKGFNGENTGILRVGNGTGIVGIDPARIGTRDVVTVSFDFYYGNLISRFAGVDLKDQTGNRIAGFYYDRYNGKAQYDDFGFDWSKIPGVGSSSASNNAIAAATNKTTFTITLDYANKIMYAKTSNSQKGEQTTATVPLGTNEPLTQFVLQSNYNNADRRCWFDNLKITVTEGNYDITTASYTVRYTLEDGETEIKSAAVREGDVDATIVLRESDKENFTDSEGVKYMYVSDDAAQTVITADGNAVATVKFRKAKTAKLQLTKVVGGENRITETDLVEADDNSCTWKYSFSMYEKTTGGEYYKTNENSFLVTGTFNDGDVIEKEVVYDIYSPHVVFFGEAEAMPVTPNGSCSWGVENPAYSGGRDGHINSANERNRGGDLGTLPAGTYILYTKINSNEGRQMVIRSMSDYENNLFILSTLGSHAHKFVLEEETHLVLTGVDYTNSAGHPTAGQSADFDYVYLVDESKTAEYTLVYVEENGEELYREVKNEAIGLPIAVEHKDITVGHTTYTYDHDDSEGKIVAADGSTVVTVWMRTPAMHWTLQTSNGVALAEGYGNEGDNLQIPFPMYANVEGTLWYVDRFDTNPYYGKAFTLMENNQVEAINATNSGLTGVVFCKEAEDIEGMIAVNSGNADIRCSSMKGAYAPAQTLITTLDAGVYVMRANVFGNTGHSFPFTIDGRNIYTQSTGGIGTSGAESAEFVVNADGKGLYLEASGNTGSSPHVVDIIYIRKIRNYDPEPTLEDGRTEFKVPVGRTLQLFVNATDAEHYEWFESDSESGPWTKLAEGINESRYTLTASAEENVTKYYKVDVWGYGGEGHVRSRVFTVTTVPETQGAMSPFYTQNYDNARNTDWQSLAGSLSLVNFNGGKATSVNNAGNGNRNAFLPLASKFDVAPDRTDTSWGLEFDYYSTAANSAELTRAVQVYSKSITLDGTNASPGFNTRLDLAHCLFAIDNASTGSLESYIPTIFGQAYPAITIQNAKVAHISVLVSDAQMLTAVVTVDGRVVFNESRDVSSATSTELGGIQFYRDKNSPTVYFDNVVLKVSTADLNMESNLLASYSANDDYYVEGGIRFDVPAADTFEWYRSSVAPTAGAEGTEKAPKLNADGTVTGGTKFMIVRTPVDRSTTKIVDGEGTEIGLAPTADNAGSYAYGVAAWTVPGVYAPEASATGAVWHYLRQLGNGEFFTDYVWCVAKNNVGELTSNVAVVDIYPVSPLLYINEEVVTSEAERADFTMPGIYVGKQAVVPVTAVNVTYNGGIGEAQYTTVPVDLISNLSVSPTLHDQLVPGSVHGRFKKMDETEFTLTYTPRETVVAKSDGLAHFRINDETASFTHYMTYGRSAVTELAPVSKKTVWDWSKLADKPELCFNPAHNTNTLTYNATQYCYDPATGLFGPRMGESYVMADFYGFSNTDLAGTGFGATDKLKLAIEYVNKPSAKACQIKGLTIKPAAAGTLVLEWSATDEGEKRSETYTIEAGNVGTEFSVYPRGENQYFVLYKATYTPDVATPTFSEWKAVDGKADINGKDTYEVVESPAITDGVGNTDGFVQILTTTPNAKIYYTLSSDAEVDGKRPVYEYNPNAYADVNEQGDTINRIGIHVANNCTITAWAEADDMNKSKEIQIVTHALLFPVDMRFMYEFVASEQDDYTTATAEDFYEKYYWGADYIEAPGTTVYAPKAYNTEAKKYAIVKINGVTYDETNQANFKVTHGTVFELKVEPADEYVFDGWGSPAVNATMASRTANTEGAIIDQMRSGASAKLVHYNLLFDKAKARSTSNTAFFIAHFKHSEGAYTADAKLSDADPVSIGVAAGNMVRAPKYHVVYEEGKTVEAWTDGFENYAPGTPKKIYENVTLTPVVRENTYQDKLNGRNDSVKVYWDFCQVNSAQPLNVMAGETFQFVAPVSRKDVNAGYDEGLFDVPMGIATGSTGRINNMTSDDWCSMGHGTRMSIPACAGAVVWMECRSKITSTSINGATVNSEDERNTANGNYVSYQWEKLTTAGVHDSYIYKYVVPAEFTGSFLDIVIGDDYSYYRNVRVDLPSVQSNRDAVLLSTDFMSFNPEGDITATFGNNGVTAVTSSTLADSEPYVHGMAGYVRTSSANGWFTIGKFADVTHIRFRQGAKASSGWKVETSLNNGASWTQHGLVEDTTTPEWVDININESVNVLIRFSSEKANTYLFDLEVYGKKPTYDAQVLLDAKINDELAGTIHAYPYTLRLDKDGKTDGTGVIQVDEDDVVTLEAVPNFGFDFVNWKDEAGNVVSSNNPYQLTVSSDTRLTACFEARGIVNYSMGGERYDGTLPAQQQTTALGGFTVPFNRTIFDADGRTLAYWYDANNNDTHFAVSTKALGHSTTSDIESSRATANVQMDVYPTFADNTLGLIDVQSRKGVDVRWDFGTANGAPEINNNTSLLMTQAYFPVAAQTIDVRMGVAGNVDNTGRADEYATINDATVLTIPATKGMKIDFGVADGAQFQYQIDGGEKVTYNGPFTYTGEANSITLTIDVTKSDVGSGTSSMSIQSLTATYYPRTRKPMFSLRDMRKESAQINVYDTSNGARRYYTLDGSDPDPVNNAANTHFVYGSFVSIPFDGSGNPVTMKVISIVDDRPSSEISTITVLPFDEHKPTVAYGFNARVDDLAKDRIFDALMAQRNGDYGWDAATYSYNLIPFDLTTRSLPPVIEDNAKVFVTSQSNLETMEAYIEDLDGGTATDKDYNFAKNPDLIVGTPLSLNYYDKTNGWESMYWSENNGAEVSGEPGVYVDRLIKVAQSTNPDMVLAFYDKILVDPDDKISISTTSKPTNADYNFNGTQIAVNAVRLLVTVPERQYSQTIQEYMAANLLRTTTNPQLINIKAFGYVPDVAVPVPAANLGELSSGETYMMLETLPATFPEYVIGDAKVEGEHYPALNGHVHIKNVAFTPENNNRLDSITVDLRLYANLDGECGDADGEPVRTYLMKYDVKRDSVQLDAAPEKWNFTADGEPMQMQDGAFDLEPDKTYTISCPENYGIKTIVFDGYGIYKKLDVDEGEVFEPTPVELTGVASSEKPKVLRDMPLYQSADAASASESRYEYRWGEGNSVSFTIGNSDGSFTGYKGRVRVVFYKRDTGKHPKLIASSIQNNQLGMPHSGIITLTFDTEMKPVDVGASIIDDSNFYMVDGAEGGTTLSFHYWNLPYIEDVNHGRFEFRLPFSSLQDVNGNEFNGNVDDAEFSGSSITVDGKELSVVNNAGNNILQIPFSITPNNYERRVFDWIASDASHQWDGTLVQGVERFGSVTDNITYNRIYVPAGNYTFAGSTFFDANQQTSIPGNKLSIVGESMESVVISNTPTSSGMSSSSTLDIQGSDVYLHALTLRNLYTESSSVKAQAPALHDRGQRNIFQNVTFESWQDTYVASGDRTYFENCNIAGVTDFICGGGDVWMEKCELQLRSGMYNIFAPSTKASTQWGFVTNNCRITPDADTHISDYTWSLARPWKPSSAKEEISPAVTFLNTTFDVLPYVDGYRNMNDGLVIRFHEYNSRNSRGDLVPVNSRSISACNPASGSDAPLLTEAGAAAYSIHSVLGRNDGYDPQEEARLLPSPVQIDFDGNTLEWTDNPAALCYMVYYMGVKGDSDPKLIACVARSANTVGMVNFSLEDDMAFGKVDDTNNSGTEIFRELGWYAVRVANQRGGLTPWEDVRMTEYTEQRTYDAVVTNGGKASDDESGYVWSTIYLDFPASVPRGVKAYALTDVSAFGGEGVTETTVTLTHVSENESTEDQSDVIYANMGYVLYGPGPDLDQSSYHFVQTGRSSDIEKSWLSGTVGKLKSGVGKTWSSDPKDYDNIPVGNVSAYTLATRTSSGTEFGLGFYKFSGSTLGHHKAYLDTDVANSLLLQSGSSTPSSVSVFRIILVEGTATRVFEITSNGIIETDDRIFNLSGQRIKASQMRHGEIYIIGGKKVIY